MKGTTCLALLAGVLGFSAFPDRVQAVGAQCVTSTIAYSWNRWECKLEVQGDFSGRRGYAETQLKVTFTSPGLPSRTTYAFWDKGTGTPTDKAQFIFRMAFPLTAEPWTWNWTTTCETPATCSATTPSLVTSGHVDVYKYGPTGSPLYAKGLLGRIDYSWPRINPTRFWSGLRFASGGGQFVWIGDSAWAAPMRATPTDWGRYLDNRRAAIGGGSAVSIVQIGPAPPWTGSVDSAANPPFDTVAGCTVSPPAETVPPTNCSRPNSNFWTAFDEKVKVANDKGIYVFLAGLMEPRSSHPTQTTSADYPTSIEAKIFARYLASRLSGSLVIFSPGFDSKLITKAPDTFTLQTAVGNELKRVAPHHLVTNHWGTVEANMMDDLQAEPWLDFQMFQSGNKAGSAHQLTDITQRARQLAWDLSGTSFPQLAPFSTTRKPAVNGEAIYEQNNVPNGNFNIYRARQTGYLSWLSGALGYTFGFGGVWDWGLCGTCVAGTPGCNPPLPNPPNACGWQLPEGWRDFSTAMGQNSNKQMKYMGGLMTSYQSGINGALDTYEQGPTGTGSPTRLNYPAANSTPEERKVAVARGPGRWLAYLPHNDKIQLKTYGLCLNPAIGKLFDPKNGVFESVAQSANLPRFRCGGTGTGAWCEWENRRWNEFNAPASDRVFFIPVNDAAGCIPTGLSSLLVFPGRLSVESPWGILGELLDEKGNPSAPLFVVSASPAGSGRNPASARGPLGTFLAVWQADDNGDGWQEIWGRLVSAAGAPTGGAFLLSPQDERDHVNPSAAASSSGDFLVAWSADGPFQGSSEILAQPVNSSGLFIGGVVTLVSEVSFDSISPKVAPNGASDFSVAWVRDDSDTPDPSVRIQRFSLLGSPRDSPQTVSTTPAPAYWLEGISIDANGNTAVDWEGRDVTSGMGRYEQVLTPAGAMIGSENQIAPPPVNE